MFFSGLVWSAPPDLDFNQIGPEHLRYGLWLKPRIRFRTGKLFRFRLDEDCELFVRNRFECPEGETFEERWARQSKLKLTSPNDLWSEVLIVLQRPKLEENTLRHFQHGNGRVPMKGNVFTLHQRFNEWICAYAIGTRQLVSGRPLKLLTDAEFLDTIHVELSIAVPPDYVLQDAEAEDVFQWSPPNRFISEEGIAGDIDDLPAHALNEIDAGLRKARAHTFYEIVLRAKAEMMSRDFTTALILACVALEGVHSAFLEVVTDRLCFDGALREEYKRELGISRLIQITPKLFMRAEHRPDDELVAACGRAFTLRNKIIHSLKNRAGEYHFRGITSGQLTEAYATVLRMYDIYVAAFESEAQLGPQVQ